MSSLFQDIGRAFRALRYSPAFTLTAIVTLALGVGANTAIFCITNSILLRPHNFRDLERLVVLREGVRGRSSEDRLLAPGDVADLKAAVSRQKPKQLRTVALRPIQPGISEIVR